MRREFAKMLHKEMQLNKDIYLVTADLGYGMWDKIKEDFPDRFINTMSSEQLMIGLCCGLALERKLPLAYSITPFLLYRPFEWIRNYLDHEKIPVKLVGGGRNKDYGYLGFSHWAEDDKKVMSNFESIKSWWPENEEALVEILDDYLFDNEPNYLNLSR